MTTEANAFFEAHRGDPLAVKFYAAANSIPEDQYKSYLTPAKFAGGGLVSFAAGGATKPKYKVSTPSLAYKIPSVSDYTNAVSQLKKNLKPEQREFYEVLKSTSLSNIKNYFDSAARSVYDKEKPLEIILDRVKNGTATAAEITQAKDLSKDLNNFRRQTTKPLWEPLGKVESQAWYKQNPELAEVFNAGKASYLSAHKDAGDLYSSVDTITKGYKPPKHTASKELYDKVDPVTGFPILDRNGLDAIFNAKGTTKLSSDTLRENYDQYGWNIKSDASTALHGPAIFGLSYGKLPAQGMMGSPGYGVQGDYEAAAKTLGIDLNQYAKPARWESTPITTMGGGETTPQLGKNATMYTDPETGEKYIAKYDPSTKQPVYEVDGNKLYNDIYDKTKDLYLVAGATEKGKGLNKNTAHASVLYRGDEEGNLVPVVNPETGQAYSKTYKAPTATSTPWYSDLFEFASDLLAMPPVQMALLFATPPGTAQLAEGLQAFAAKELGTKVSAELAKAVAKGLVNFGTNLIATKGDFEKSLISGVTSGVFSYYTPTVVNNIVGLGDPTKGAQFVKDLAVAGGITKDQAYKIIENAGVTATKNKDPNQFISQIAAQFAGAVTSNNVAQFLAGQDKKTINFFSGVAGDFANVSASALANGMGLDEAWKKYGADIIANRVQNYGEGLIDELKPTKDTTAALPTDQVSALNPPGSDTLTGGGAETDVIDLNQPGYDETDPNVDPELLAPDVGTINPEDIPKDPNAGVTDGEVDVDAGVLEGGGEDTISPEDIPKDPNQPGYDETDPNVDPELLDPDVGTINPEDIPEDPNQPGYDETDPDLNIEDLEGPGTPPVTPPVIPPVKPPVTPPVTPPVKPPVTPPKTTANTGSNAAALLALLQGQQQAPAQNITPPELAKIGYFYDIGGEDIFNVPQDKNKTQDNTFKQFYATGGTVEDLFRILRS